MTGVTIVAIICCSILALACIFFAVGILKAKKDVTKIANDILTRVDKTFDEESL